MIRPRPVRILSTLTLLACSIWGGPAARADPIVAGSTNLLGTATMDLTLYPGTPFNSSTSAVVLRGISGVGVITIARDAQVGGTINISSVSGGMFVGADPNLGGYVFGNVAPLTGADFHATLTNVVQNPNDPGFALGNASSFKSGDFTLTGNSFGFHFITGPAAGVTLFTDPATPFAFAGSLGGLPPRDGNSAIFSTGTDALNVLFGTQVVGQTFNRVIRFSAVPEPSSALMRGIGALGLMSCARRRAGRAG